MARCPVCTCSVINEQQYDYLMNQSFAKTSGRAGIVPASGIVGFMCTGCGIRFKFEPPDPETLLVLGVMEC